MAGRTRDDDSSGAYDLRSRLRKSKMLCFAGFTPVANVDQATEKAPGMSCGAADRNLLPRACLNSASLPSAMNRSANFGSNPSSPRKIAFFTFALR